MPVETYTTAYGQDGVVISNPLDEEGPTLSIERVRGIAYVGIMPPFQFQWTQVDVDDLFEALALLGLNPKGAE